jgi:hypothetical protein
MKYSKGLDCYLEKINLSIIIQVAQYDYVKIN